MLECDFSCANNFHSYFRFRSWKHLCAQAYLNNRPLRIAVQCLCPNAAIQCRRLRRVCHLYTYRTIRHGPQRRWSKRAALHVPCSMFCRPAVPCPACSSVSSSQLSRCTVTSSTISWFLSAHPVMQSILADRPAGISRYSSCRASWSNRTPVPALANKAQDGAMRSAARASDRWPHNELLSCHLGAAVDR